MGTYEYKQKKIAWIRRRGSKQILIGSIMVGAVIMMVVVSLFYTPFDPNATDLFARRAAPSLLTGEGTHLLGTDQLGRDMLSRTMAGGQISLLIAILTLIGTTFIGVVAGLLSGFYEGTVDAVFSITADIRNSMPTTLFIIVALAVLGSSIPMLIFLMALVEWVTIFRTVRARTIVEKNKEYVLAAYCAGANDKHVIFKYILPNVISEVIVLVTLLVSSIVLLEASLSFLGVGVTRPFPSWGRMISDGSDYISTAWWISTVPAATIIIFVMGINFLGDGLQKALKME